MPELAKDESASSDALGRPTRAAETSLTPEWRDYFLRLVQNPLRFSGPRNYLGRDMRSAMRRLVPQDAKVLEVGTGKGDLLAELPNARRHGIDVLPEAVAATRARDSKVSVEQADALTFTSGERYDAVICDRLCHSIPDVQKLLANLAEHLSADGRIFLTCFNFIWAIPLLLAAKLGFYEKAPEQNWLSESDFENLFALAGVEVVHSEDRILVPLRIPLLDFFLNRFLAKLPPWRFFSLYRIYVLRPRIVAPVDRRGVGQHALATDAAEQRVQRHPGGLAGDVPQRDVDAGDRLHLHAAGAAGEGTAHVLPARGDVERALADHRGLEQAVDDRGVGHRARPPEDLAPAGQAGIGHDLDHGDVERGPVALAGGLHGRQLRAQRVGDHVDDLHPVVLRCGSVVGQAARIAIRRRDA